MRFSVKVCANWSRRASSALRIGSGHRERALPGQAPTIGLIPGDLPERPAAHALHAVVKRETLVHEGLVRRQQVENARIRIEHAADEELDLFREVTDEIRR